MMGKHRTTTEIRKTSGNRFVWVNTDSESQGTISQNPMKPETTNPVAWTDAGSAIPAVSGVTMKSETCEETSIEMTDSNIGKTNGSKLCRLLCTICCFWLKKDDNSPAKLL
jgi:hypothetical protein